MKKYLCTEGHEFDEPVIEKPKRWIEIKKCPTCSSKNFGIQTYLTVKNLHGGIHWSDPEYRNHHILFWLNDLTPDENSDMVRPIIKKEK